MVTFTSLRVVPLAFRGISDFLCLKPGSVSSAGICFSLCETLRNFAVCLSRLFFSSVHLQIWTRKRRTEVEVKDGDTVKTLSTRFYTSAHKREKGKVKMRGKSIQRRKSVTFSLSRERDVDILLAFPKFKWPLWWITRRMFNARLKARWFRAK